MCTATKDRVLPGTTTGSFPRPGWLDDIPAEQLVVSSDCGFRRQGCTREPALSEASAIAMSKTAGA